MKGPKPRFIRCLGPRCFFSFYFNNLNVLTFFPGSKTRRNHARTTQDEAKRCGACCVASWSKLLRAPHRAGGSQRRSHLLGHCAHEKAGWRKPAQKAVMSTLHRVRPLATPVRSSLSPGTTVTGIIAAHWALRVLVNMMGTGTRTTALASSSSSCHPTPKPRFIRCLGPRWFSFSFYFNNLNVLTLFF
jgi:hypothetical protein